MAFAPALRAAWVVPLRPALSVLWLRIAFVPAHSRLGLRARGFANARAPAAAKRYAALRALRFALRGRPGSVWAVQRFALRRFLLLA